MGCECAVRIRVAFVERSAGGLVLGPPKSKAGRRTVGIPRSIVPILREHMETYVKDDPAALMFPARRVARSAGAASTPGPAGSTWSLRWA